MIAKVKTGEGVKKSRVNTSSAEGIVALYAMPNPFLLTKICLNQEELLFGQEFEFCIS